MQVPSGLLLFLVPWAVVSVNVVPKTDFGEEGSQGISPEIVKTIIEKNLEPTVNPGVIKAILEVNVGAVTPKSKPETKTDEKDEKKKKKNQVLICTLDGNCKLHTVILEDDAKEDEEEKTVKPVIVTDFDVDPSKEKHDGDKNKNKGKDTPDVPVFVGHKGAVQNDGFSYHTGHGHQYDRLPVYYGMKLSPEFHQSYPPPGSIIYEEDHHRYPPSPGSYPSYPYEHGVSYLYSNDEDDFPIEYPGHPGSDTYGNSFSGHSGARTPTPYGNIYPTRKPNYQGVITPLHRRTNGGGWSSTPGARWSTRKSNKVPQVTSSGWVGTNSPGWVGSNSPGWVSSNTPNWVTPSTPGVVGSKRPGVYWPYERPNEDSPPPAIISVHDKMDFDQVTLNGGPDDHSGTPNTGKGEITVDGKLGEPLDKEESK